MAAPQRETRRMLATTHLNRLPATERGITIGDFLVPIRLGERVSARIRHIALICVGAVFISLTANVAIALPGNPIPFTGQTLSVLVVCTLRPPSPAASCGGRSACAAARFRSPCT